MDPTASRKRYERYVDRVHQYFVRRTGDDDAARDLTAKTFARAYEARARFSDRSGGSAGP